MSILELILLFIAVIIVVIIALLNAISASSITSITNYESDPALKRAHELLTWSSILGWLGLFILVGLMAYYFSRPYNQKDQVSKLSGVRILLFVTTILIFITGILSASAAVEMDKVSSTNKKALDDSGARGLTNWSAILGIVGAVLVIAALVISYFTKKSKAKKSKTKQTKSKTKEPKTKEVEMKKVKDD